MQIVGKKEACSVTLIQQFTINQQNIIHNQCHQGRIQDGSLGRFSYHDHHDPETSAWIRP